MYTERLFLERLSGFAGVQGRGIDQPDAALETEGLLGPGCGEEVNSVANGALSESPHTMYFFLGPAPTSWNQPSSGNSTFLDTTSLRNMDWGFKAKHTILIYSKLTARLRASHVLYIVQLHFEWTAF